jgi:polyhydroxyalkanoate synthesis regulator phasin
MVKRPFEPGKGNGLGGSSGQPGFDFNTYKKLYNIWMRSTSEMLEEMMRSPQFSEMAGKALSAGADLKQQVDEMIQTSLKNMNLPTTSDIESLSQQIRHLETRVERLMERVETVGPAPPSSRRSKPSRPG